MTQEEREFAEQKHDLVIDFLYRKHLSMLAEMERRGHTFTEPDNLFVDCRENPRSGGGFVDFHGNRNEVSAAFHYRIYDVALLERIHTAAALIIERSRKLEQDEVYSD